ncbi:PREDICTED: uncharacterized protein LOC109126838 [Camelina sativa]|uniref:Uncharacterized protein LOC109126838 n=1 Tax=Camelina sativa TaxID=90675 RepID=A0ABM1QHL5_CAMSA|nr:PREDICTED: uncharacterized protein LOC109126838 [Camelina sativa]
MEKKGIPITLDSGELCVKIPNMVVQRNQNRWKDFIIGQFHGNLPSKGALYAILNGIWSRKRRDITISKQGPKSVLIRIPCEETRKRVLAQRVWHIEGQSMFVADWEPDLSPVMPELTEAPVWLEFRGVPPQFFSQEALEYIAGLVGHPVFCHPSTINLTDLEVAKVFTIVNITKPLPEAVNAQFETGETFRIVVSSPWLPPICAFCQGVGHSIKRCPTAPILCSFCNSTSHSKEACTRGRHEGKTTAEVPMARQRKNPSRRRKEHTKRRSEGVENPPIDPSVSLQKEGNLEIDIGLTSVHKTAKSGMKKAASRRLPPSSSSSSDAASLEESSSSDSPSEEDDNPDDNDKFMKVLSKKEKKKERRYAQASNANYEFAELGRIWIVWHHSVKLVIHSKSKQMMTCVVQLPGEDSEFVISFVYAVNHRMGRQELWEEICALSRDQSVNTRPWALLRDFNQTLSPAEHSSGGTRIKRGMEEFRECLAYANLQDLTFRGNQFTWWNKQETNPIAKKLDRVLANDEWRIKYPLSYSQF